MVVFVIAIGLLLSIISIYKFDKLLNPIAIYVIPHTVALSFLLGSDFLDKDLSFRSYVAFFSAELMYCLGVYLSGFITFKVAHDKGKRLSLNFYWVIAVSSLIVDIFIIIFYIRIQNTFGIIHAITDLSEYNIFLQNEGVTGAINVMVFFSIPLSMLIHYSLKRLNDLDNRPMVRVLLRIQFVICFVPYISARRSLLIFVIIMNLILYFLLDDRRRSISLNNFLIVFISIYFVLLFFSKTQQLMNKTSDISMSCFGISIPPMLKDAFGYVAGNYSYLNKALNNGVSMGELPFMSTLRIFYIYISPLLGLKPDVNSPFDLSFLPIGDSIDYVFNTVPIHYYFIIDSGFAYFIEFLILGFICGSIYKNTLKNKTCWDYLNCSFLFAVVLMSFREYDLIFTYSVITIASVWLLKRFDYKINKIQGGEGL